MFGDGLHETLDCLAQAALAVENGWPYSAETHLLGASAAAPDSFPEGTPEADALNIILGAVTAAAAAAGLLQDPPDRAAA
jgi:hypothetical protein